MWYKNIAGRFFGLESTRVTDGRTDRRTELRLPRPIQRSTVDVINIAADRQKFMTLTGELS